MPFFRLCLSVNTVINWWTLWRSWLRLWASSKKTAGSIPDGVIGIFYCNDFGRTDRNECHEYFVKGKDGRCVGRHISHLHVPIILKSGSLKPPWTLRACPGLCRDSLLEPSCIGIALPFFTLINCCLLFVYRLMQERKVVNRVCHLNVTESITHWRD